MSLADCVREAFFAETPDGVRFCLFSRPAGDMKGGVLFVPPFAEEMNKSRRMVAIAARAFVNDGWAVMQIDPKGCGDSAGDFGDAAWADWLADLSAGWELLGARLSDGLPRVLWSLRGGSLLAADWLAVRQSLAPWLMWQPVTNGKQHLTQFLRLRAANEMLGDSEARNVMARLRAELAEGSAVDVAGYRLAPALAAGLDGSTLLLPKSYRGPLAIVEMSMTEEPVASPAVSRAVLQWREASVDVRFSAVRGPAFWHTQEIETAPEALEPSLQFLGACVS